MTGTIILGGTHGSLAAARSLGRQGGKVAFFHAHPNSARYSRYVTHDIAWGGPGADGALAYFLGAADRLGLDGWVILPGSDADVQFVTQHFVALSTRFRLVTQPWQELEQLNNKAQLYRLANRLGIACPQVYADGLELDQAFEAMRFPVVIKPSLTEKHNPLTRAKAWRAENAAEYASMSALAARYMRPDGFVVQELIPGDGSTQYSYAGLWDHGREICGLTARRARQFPAEFGTSPYVEAIPAPGVAEQARTLLKAVGYHGLVEVEFKRDLRDDRLKLLDVNTRIWAWIGLGAAAGLDFPLLAQALAVGDAVIVGEVSYGASWRHTIPNVLSLLLALLRNGRPGYAGVRSLLSRPMSAIFALDDIKPAVAEVPVQLYRRLVALRRR